MLRFSVCFLSLSGILTCTTAETLSEKSTYASSTSKDFQQLIRLMSTISNIYHRYFLRTTAICHRYLNHLRAGQELYHYQMAFFKMFASHSQCVNRSYLFKGGWRNNGSFNLIQTLSIYFSTFCHRHRNTRLLTGVS